VRLDDAVRRVANGKYELRKRCWPQPRLEDMKVAMSTQAQSILLDEVVKHRSSARQPYPIDRPPMPGRATIMGVQIVTDDTLGVDEMVMRLEVKV